MNVSPDNLADPTFCVYLLELKPFANPIESNWVPSLMRLSRSWIFCH